MKSSVLKTCLTAALLFSAALTGAAEVYTWKGTSGNSYSDTPNRLQPKRSGVVNIRTHNVNTKTTLINTAIKLTNNNIKKAV